MGQIIIVFIIIGIIYSVYKSATRSENLFADSDTPFYGWKIEELTYHDIGHYEQTLPWDDVAKSKYIGKRRKSVMPRPCPLCSQEHDKNATDHIRWVYFKSPASTWQKMCGREGYLSICTKHKVQVSFECTRMN